MFLVTVLCLNCYGDQLATRRAMESRSAAGGVVELVLCLCRFLLSMAHGARKATDQQRRA